MADPTDRKPPAEQEMGNSERVQFHNRVLDYIDRRVEHVEAALEPWNVATDEMARLMISLSSGAIVVTVTLVQYLQAAGRHPFASGGDLKVAWVAFAIVDFVGVLRFAVTGRLRLIRAQVFPKREEILSVALKLSREEIVDGTAAVTNALFSDLARMIRRMSSWKANVEAVMVTVFAVGMFELVTFALANFNP